MADPRESDSLSRTHLCWNISLFFQLLGIASSTFLPLYWSAIGYGDSVVAEIDSIGFFLSLFGPLFAAYRLRHLSYRIFVTSSFFLSGSASLLMYFSNVFKVQMSGFVVCLLCMGVFAAMVPLSAVVMLSHKNFGTEYGKYRKFGSYGFLAGLLLSGFLSDIYSPAVFPLLTSLGFFGAGISFMFVKIDEHAKIFNERFSIKKIFFSRGLLLFGLAQIIIWSSFSICFRFLPLRMAQMGSSSFFISVTVSSFGILALFSLPWVGRLSDRFSGRILWPIIPVALFLRILLLTFPESNFYWFLPMQVLHIPTWVLADILVVKYLKDKREELGALSISVLTQFGMILGLSLGSYGMSITIPFWGLKDSFLMMSFFPLLFLPLFMIRWETRDAVK